MFKLATTLSGLKSSGFPKVYGIYLAAMALHAAGFADFPLIGYHFRKHGMVSADMVPVFYSVAMGASAVTALIFGRLFDRRDLGIVIIAVCLPSFFAPWYFLGGFAPGLFGMAPWDVGMGAQESVMRAAVAGMVQNDRRATAYGIFNTGYGIFWFLV